MDENTAVETMEVYLLEPVTYRGSKVNPGNVLELPVRSAKDLIKTGHATRHDNAKEKKTAPEENTANQAQNEKDQEKVAEDKENARLQKALDAQYKRDELVERAKEVGVEFPFDAKKSEVIDAVIEQEKYAALLK